MVGLFPNNYVELLINFQNSMCLFICGIIAHNFSQIMKRNTRRKRRQPLKKRIPRSIWMAMKSLRTSQSATAAALRRSLKFLPLLSSNSVAFLHHLFPSLLMLPPLPSPLHAVEIHPLTQHPHIILFPASLPIPRRWICVLDGLLPPHFSHLQRSQVSSMLQ